MISSSLPRVTRIAVLGTASARARVVAQAIAQIPNVEIVEVPVEEKREPVSMPVASARKDPKSRPRGVPFVITTENREAWQCKSGERARGVIVDGAGRFYADGDGASRGRNLDRQWARSEKSAARKFGGAK